MKKQDRINRTMMEMRSWRNFFNVMAEKNGWEIIYNDLIDNVLAVRYNDGCELVQKILRADIDEITTDTSFSEDNGETWEDDGSSITRYDPACRAWV